MKTTKISIFLAAVLVFVFGLGMSAFILTTQAEPKGEKPQRVIVVLDDDAVYERSRVAISQRGGQVVRDLKLINGMAVILPEQAAVDNVTGLGSVKYVEEDIIVYAIHHRDGHTGGPGNGGGDDDEGDDPVGPDQEIDWGVNRIQAPEAWDEGFTGEGVRVSVLDTGVSLSHSDLTVVRGADCTRGPNCDQGGNKGDDDNGHGTHVAGTIAALDNEIGVVGVAHEAHLLSAKVLNSRGSGFLSDVIAGIEWSVNNNAQVINMSLGSTSNAQAFEAAVDAAHAENVVLVAASGNNGHKGSTNYPAAYDSVIAVGATDENDNLAGFSNAGAYVELVAPGVDINSTWLNNGYNVISGTSMASPHVAGVAALIIAGGESVNEKVRSILIETAEEISLHAPLVKAWSEAVVE